MVKLENITYSVGDFTLSPISLTVGDGEYFALLGPSGSGKSILLELIAGLRKTSGGNIYCNDSDITTLSPQKRPVGLLFQDYALFPHLSVFENIAYPLKMLGIPLDTICADVRKLASSLEISSLLERSPETLSGGEKQRVALARTLAKSPSVLLLDEPLSALDASLRSSSLQMLKGLTANGKLSIIHVTHDEQEARKVAERIGYLEKGTLTHFL